MNMFHDDVLPEKRMTSWPKSVVEVKPGTLLNRKGEPTHTRWNLYVKCTFHPTKFTQIKFDAEAVGSLEYEAVTHYLFCGFEAVAPTRFGVNLDLENTSVAWTGAVRLLVGERLFYRPIYSTIGQSYGAYKEITAPDLYSPALTHHRVQMNTNLKVLFRCG